MQPVLSKAEARAKIGLPQDKRIVTYAGRINEKKGLEVILELARRMPEVMFVLVGSTGRGPIEIEAESQDNVRIVPWQTSSSISPYLYATDVLTIPPSTVIATILAWAMGSWDVGMCAVAVIASIVGGLFASLPWLNVKGRRRWLGFAAFAAVGFGIGLGVLLALHSATHLHLYLAAGTALATMGVLSIDLAGTTPWYGSYINRFHNEAHVDLVEDRCTGAAECVQVCPRNVLQMNGRRRKVEIRRPDQCIQCGACIVQCPEDALRFRYEDGRVVEAPTIRRTRMNMVGRRTVEVSN
jgi:NAD-dependent dihydropyrimidine dehydrogenase PreA subunit